jgi:hypothetical protein
MLRGCKCHVIVPNVRAPTEDKSDDVKDSFYKELKPQQRQDATHNQNYSTDLVTGLLHINLLEPHLTK